MVIQTLDDATGADALLSEARADLAAANAVVEPLGLQGSPSDGDPPRAPRALKYRVPSGARAGVFAVATHHGAAESADCHVTGSVLEPCAAMVAAWARGEVPSLPTNKAVPDLMVAGTEVVAAESCASRAASSGWSLECPDVTLSYLPAPARMNGKRDELAGLMAQQLRDRAATVHVDTRVLCELAGRPGSCLVLEVTSQNGTRVRFTLGGSGYLGRDFALLCADARGAKSPVLPPPCSRVMRTE